MYTIETMVPIPLVQ